MPPDKYLHYKPLVFKKSNYWLFVSLFWVFISFSCNKKEASNPDSYSDAFKPVYDTTTRFYDLKKRGEAIHYLDSAFRHISKPWANDQFRYYAVNFMYCRKVTHNVKLELAYADSMLVTAQRSINQKRYVSNYAEACFAKGDAYFDAKQYSNAYRCFYDGYFLGENHLDNSLMAEYTYRMGMIMFRQAHFLLAAKYFKDSYRQSLAYTDDFRAFYQRQELLDNIGESYDNNGNIDSAIKYYNQTITYIIQNNERFTEQASMLDVARAVVYGNEGKIFLDKGDYSTAKELLKKSIDINLKKHNDNYNAELVEINLARLYLKTKNQDSFISLMNNIHQQLNSVKNEDAETNWNRLMSDYYESRNDFQKAIGYYKNYNLLKDSLNQLASLLKETDIAQQSANYDKQYQIENLKDDNKLQEVYLYLALVSVSMALIVIFLIYRNLERSNRDILAVSSLNAKINSQKINLESTLKELKINSQEKDRILRTVVHDLRNPIGGIVSLTKAMLEDEYTKEQKQLLSLVNDTSFNSLELINEILEATNNTSSVHHKELVEINSLVNNSVEILNFKAAEKNQKIITELLEKPQKLFLSREKIWRVISNLISNAIKFSPNNTVILVKVICKKNVIKISVTDNGIGIPNNIKDEVFNIFTDAKREGTAGEKSFGLGLSICKQIMEEHKGKIWFESDVKTGTTFYISLPLILS